MKLPFFILGSLFLSQSQAAILVSATGSIMSHGNGGLCSAAGSPTLSVSFTANAGETAPFLIKVLNGGSVIRTSQSSSGHGGGVFYGLPSGNYTVTVTSANGISGSAPAVAPVFDPIVISANVEHVTPTVREPSPSNGKIDVTATGGQGLGRVAFYWNKGDSASGPFPRNVRYQPWGSVGSAPDLQNLPAGFYEFKVATQSGCFFAKVFEVKLKSAPALPVSRLPGH